VLQTFCAKTARDQVVRHLLV